MEIAIAAQAPQTIYLNSLAARGSVGSANQLVFNFVDPIDHVGSDILYAKITSFSAFNSFSNVIRSSGNNMLKVLNVFYNASSTTNSLGAPAFSYFTILNTIIVPDGHYTNSTLQAYLNTRLATQQTVTGANWTSNTTTAILYLGFGFSGTNNATTTTAISSVVLSGDVGKYSINAAGTGSSFNTYTKTYTSGSIATDPFAYAGVYLIDDEDTVGLMRIMGCSNANVDTPLVYNNMRGVGFQFSPNVLPTPVMPKELPYIYNLAGPETLYITIDTLANNSRSNDGFMNSKNIVGAIPVNAYYQGLILYDSANDRYDLVNGIDTTTMTVTIYDEKKNIVDFRGGSWQAELQIITKSNAKDDHFNKQTANHSTNIMYDVGQPEIHNRITKRQNPYGGMDMRAGLYRPQKR